MENVIDPHFQHEEKTRALACEWQHPYVGAQTSHPSQAQGLSH